jgi:hypothetical protein
MLLYPWTGVPFPHAFALLTLPRIPTRSRAGTGTAPFPVGDGIPQHN